jgi:16S rRNA (guanine966-N2)-methyltransferase
MRIISGSLKGRSLVAPRGAATRPTSSRAREAIFSMLGNIRDARVLDLYSGSGALSFEALSRGAAHAVLVEMSRPALAAIQTNLDQLGMGAQAAVLALRVEVAENALRKHAPFDLVFADPPWADAQVALRNLEKLARAGVIAEEAWVVLEHSARAPPELSQGSELSANGSRAWDDTAVHFFRRQL